MENQKWTKNRNGENRHEKDRNEHLEMEKRQKLTLTDLEKPRHETKRNGKTGMVDQI